MNSGCDLLMIPLIPYSLVKNEYREFKLSANSATVANDSNNYSVGTANVSRTIWN